MESSDESTLFARPRMEPSKTGGGCLGEGEREVVAVTKEEENIIIIIITERVFCYNNVLTTFVKKPQKYELDKSPTTQRMHGRWRIFRKLHKTIFTRKRILSEEKRMMFTTTPMMNALFLPRLLLPTAPPPPPPHARISSRKRSSNNGSSATFRRTTLCVTPRATASSSSSSSTTTNNNNNNNKKKIIVKVQPQQTLSIVSKENGISVPDIVRLNGLGTRRTLQVGERLIVSDFEGKMLAMRVLGIRLLNAEMTTMVITSSTDEEKTTVEKEKEIVSSSSSSSSSPSTTSPTDETTTEEKEQNVKKILRLVPENAKEAIMRKIERLKVETTNESDTSTASLVQVVPRSVTASVPFTTSFGVGVGAAVLSMALVATNIGRDDIGKEEEEEEEEEERSGFRSRE